MTAKPLSAEEEAALRKRCESVRCGWCEQRHEMNRLFATLDASRAETAAVVRERDEARADQATLDRVLAAFGIANTGLDAGNYAKALCVGLEQMRSLAADLVEGLAHIRTHGPLSWMPNGRQCRDVVEALLTRAAALGVGKQDGEKGEPSEVTVRRMREEWPYRQVDGEKEKGNGG